MPFLTSASVDPARAGGGYPFSLPAVRGLDQVRFAPVTVFVGDNGTGKSTLAEALAIGAGLNAEGGSKNLRFTTHPTHSELHRALVMRWTTRPRWGWFLRAETFYGMASHIHDDDDPLSGVKALFPDLHDRSHGESFLTLIESRMQPAGFYVLDEPESALSFHGQLTLLYAMRQALDAGAQFVLATHSPILMAYPGAAIYQLDDTGIHETAYDDLESVQLWRNFLSGPEGFFRHLFETDPPEA